MICLNVVTQYVLFTLARFYEYNIKYKCEPLCIEIGFHEEINISLACNYLIKAENVLMTAIFSVSEDYRGNTSESMI